MIETKNGYRLYSKLVELKKGYFKRIYFFSRRTDGWELVDSIPEGMKICISEYTGLPMLKKSHASSSHKEMRGGLKEDACLI